MVESFEKHQIYCNCAAETRNVPASCQMMLDGGRIHPGCTFLVGFAKIIDVVPGRVYLDGVWMVLYARQFLVQCVPHEAGWPEVFLGRSFGKTPVNDWIGRKPVRFVGLSKVYDSNFLGFSDRVNEANFEV